MRQTVFVPATPDGLDVRVVPAILAAGRDVHVALCRGDLGYSMSLAAAWRPEFLLLNGSAGALTIIEHDVIVTREILDTFDACSYNWCVNPYNDHHALGCTRFRPHALGPWPIDHAVPWAELDMRLSEALAARGHRPHVHREHRPRHVHGEVRSAHGLG